MSIFGITKKKALALFREACQTGNFSKAIPAYEKLITKINGDHELYNDLGFMYLELKQFKKSEENFKKAVELSENAINCNNLGRAYLAQGNNMDAMDSFQKARKLDSTDPQPWYNIIVCYQEQNRKEDAFNELNKFLKSFPKHSNGLNNLGNHLIEKGDMESALKSYEKCIESDPGNFIGRANIIKTLCDLNRFQESKPYLEAFAASGVNVKVDASDGRLKIFFNDRLFHECDIKL